MSVLICPPVLFLKMVSLLDLPALSHFAISLSTSRTQQLNNAILNISSVNAAKQILTFSLLFCHSLTFTFLTAACQSFTQQSCYVKQLDKRATRQRESDCFPPRFWWTVHKALKILRGLLPACRSDSWTHSMCSERVSQLLWRPKWANVHFCCADIWMSFRSVVWWMCWSKNQKWSEFHVWRALTAQTMRGLKISQGGGLGSSSLPVCIHPFILTSMNPQPLLHSVSKLGTILD